MFNLNLKSLAFLLIISSCSNKEIVYTKPNQYNAVKTIENPLPESKVDSLLKEHQIKGASISYLNDRFSNWTKSYGYADDKNLKPVTNTTQFQAAEISKTITTFAVLILAKADKINLDSDLLKYITSLNIENNFPNTYISLRNLLKHRGGFNISKFEPYTRSDSLPNSMEILHGESPATNEAIKLIYEPIKTLQHSDGGYHFVQVLLETIMREPYENFVSNYIFHQLEMKNSSFIHPVDTSTTSSGFTAENTVIENQWNLYPQSAAQGLWTTSSDLAQVVREMLLASNGKSRHLSFEGFQEMLDNRLSLNYDYDKKVFSFSGQNEGYTTYFSASTDNFKGIVIIVNSGNGGAFINDVLKLIESN